MILMFDPHGQLLVTNGVKASASEELQYLCWTLVFDKINDPRIALCPLQRFEFTKDKKKNEITIHHLQSQPSMDHCFVAPITKETRNLKISELWVVRIDELGEKYQIMLLPDEKSLFSKFNFDRYL